MEVAVVDCNAPTVEKKELVDTQAITKEKRDMVNSAQSTKLRPSFVTLRYKINEPNTKIIPFLPPKIIEKSNGEPVKFGRTENFDVFLNDECMSRNYAHMYAEKNDSSQFKVINYSSSKTVIVDNRELRQNEICYIQDKSVLQLDIITFFVSIRCGDKNADGYVVSILPENEITQQLCRVPSFQMQNFGNCNLTCCCNAQANPQIHNSLIWPQMYPQNHNSSTGIPVCPQNHNSSTGIPVCSQNPNSSIGLPVCPQIHNFSTGIPVCPQIHNFSTGIPMCSQIHNSSSGIPVSPQIHNSSSGIPVSPQIHNSSTGIPVSPQIHNSSTGISVYPHVNMIQSIPKSPDKKGLNRREPQEHSMPSENVFLTEKQRQYQFIENMNRKLSN